MSFVIIGNNTEFSKQHYLMTVTALKNIYQLKITLQDSRPQITRKFLVPSTMTLDDLHTVIQIVMGWYDCHMHQFVINGEFYCPVNEDYDWESKDESQYKVSHVLKQAKDEIVYEYDFGDGWLHDVVLEKILPYDNSVTLPICILGKRACPPENCGGVWGYKDILKIASNPKHPEYEDMMEWLPEGFDPEHFDLEETNEVLYETFTA